MPAPKERNLRFRLAASESALALCLAAWAGLCDPSQLPALAQGSAPKPLPAAVSPEAAKNIKIDQNAVFKQLNIHFSKEIPTNFPVPVYPSNVVKKLFDNSTKGSPTASVLIVTKDSPQTVFAWYQDFFKKDSNWQVKTPTQKLLDKLGKGNDFYMLEAEDQKQHLSIFCMKDKKTANTKINIGWRKKR